MKKLHKFVKFFYNPKLIFQVGGNPKSPNVIILEYRISNFLFIYLFKPLILLNQSKKNDFF